VTFSFGLKERFDFLLVDVMEGPAKIDAIGVVEVLDVRYVWYQEA
jgi:hypothetical protein